MKLEVKRFNDTGEASLGILLIDGKFECYTLEDEERTIKKWGETRIPEGTYKIGLRTGGGHHERYSQKFPEFHEGMLHVLDVPKFEYILIHIGNREDDTAGCLLVGTLPGSEDTIIQSTIAYKKVYPKVLEAIKRGEPVTITYSKVYESDIAA